MRRQYQKYCHCESTNVDDASRLASAHSVLPAGLLELGKLAQQLDPRWASIGVTRSIISLQQLVKMYLDKPLKKGLAFSTNWENRDLNPVERLCTSIKVRPWITLRCGKRLLCSMESFSVTRSDEIYVTWCQLTKSNWLPTRIRPKIEGTDSQEPNAFT